MAKVFPLSEGVFTIGHDKEFVPFNIDTDILTDRPIGSLLVEIQPFLVVTDKDVILLDTGLGYNTSAGIPQIHDNIAAHGFGAGEVTKVLLTHLHKDHAGGILRKHLDGKTSAMFPNAQYYIYGPEAAYALEKGAPSYQNELYADWLSSDQISWLAGEEGSIEDYIFFKHSGAHSLQHIVFWIKDAEDIIFYGGDEAPQYKQMIMKYVAKYDTDGKKAMELRAQYADQGKSEHWQFLFYHDVKMPTAYL
jgi:glyoxylase-like metal-dependent hydrolase (beta-lactamase superfamily II)